MADGAGFWMGVHQILLDVSIAPSYIKFGHNGGIQHPLLKIIKKFGADLAKIGRLRTPRLGHLGGRLARRE